MIGYLAVGLLVLTIPWMYAAGWIPYDWAVLTALAIMGAALGFDMGRELWRLYRRWKGVA